MYKVHIIPHFHWDREWYFTTSRSKIYLMYDLKNVLDTLENDPEFKYFVVDGQASLLEDYVAWRPEDEERMARLVKEGRLLIGPWYTQSDLMVISGESIVRNLYYGIKACEKYGPYMNVAYVPDSFGQAGNMPQVYKSFGIEDTLFWRGVSDDMVSKTEYTWTGDDGTDIFVVQMPSGYYIGGNMPTKPEDNDLFWKLACFDFLGYRASSNNLYFPNGFDQAPIRTDLPKLLDMRRKRDPENEYVISNPVEYIKDVKASHPTLENVQGELLIAKHMRIHKSIFSSRSDLKAMNTEIQNYVVNTLEPLLFISYLKGNEYPHKTVETIWKLLFENAAHDSIGSCIADSPNEDVYMRYKQARDLAENLVELHSRLVATSSHRLDQTLTWTLFNTYPATRSETILFDTYLPEEGFGLQDKDGQAVAYTVLDKVDVSDYVFAQTIKLDPSFSFYLPKKVYRATIAIQKKDVPALGYTQIELSQTSTEQALKNVQQLENEFYNLEFNKDGSFNVLVKASKKRYVNQGILVENGDDGDSFNYSPPRQDMVISSQGLQANVQLEASSLIGQAKVKTQLRVPADLEARAKQQADQVLPIELTVRLRANSPVIELAVKVDNKVKSHRLCIQFDTELVTNMNFADQQFGVVKRPNVYKKEMELYLGQKLTPENEKESLLPTNWQQSTTSWQEPPISIETCQTYVALSKQDETVAVYPQGVREYQIIDDKTIQLTLFRTYGFMGKEDLLYRPGRASGEKVMETPAAQLLKEMTFRLGVAYFNESFNHSNLEQVGKRFNTPVSVYEYAAFLNGRLMFSQMEKDGQDAKEASFMTGTNQAVLSCLKKAEDKPGLIVRYYNGKDQEEVEEKLTFTQVVKKAALVNSKEEVIQELSVDENEVKLPVLKHCQFVTLYIEF